MLIVGTGYWVIINHLFDYYKGNKIEEKKNVDCCFGNRISDTADKTVPRYECNFDLLCPLKSL